MKNVLLLPLGVVVSLCFLLGCNKMEFIPSDEDQLFGLEERTETENKFFKYDYLSGVNPSVDQENLVPLMTDMIDKTITLLKARDEVQPFADVLKDKIGYPLWNCAREFVSEGLPTAIIPFAFESGDHVTAFLIVINKNNSLEYRLVHGNNIFNAFVGLGMENAPDNIFIIMEYLLLEEIVFKTVNCGMHNALDYIANFDGFRNEDALDFRECYIIEITQSLCITVTYEGIILGPRCENSYYYDYICFEDPWDNLDNLDITPISGDNVFSDNGYTTSGYDVGDEELARLLFEYERIDFDGYGLTEAEIRLLLDYQHRIERLTDNKRKAVNFSLNTDCPPTTLDNGAADALRLAYFSALNTRDYGAHFAYQAIESHENHEENPPLERQMDLYNSQIGIQLASQHPNATEAELQVLIYGALESGQLVVLSQSGTSLVSSSGC